MNLRGERQADFAYQAVYRYMINLINEVSLDMPVKLPSLRQLATRLNVSISTIQYAYPCWKRKGGCIRWPNRVISPGPWQPIPLMAAGGRSIGAPVCGGAAARNGGTQRR